MWSGNFSQMSARVVLLQSPLSRAKSRLAPLFFPEERREFVVARLRDALAVARNVDPCPAICSPDPYLALHAATGYEAFDYFFDREGAGFWLAIKAYSQSRGWNGAEPVVFLPTDVIGMSSQDVALVTRILVDHDLVACCNESGGVNVLGTRVDLSAVCTRMLAPISGRQDDELRRSSEEAGWKLRVLDSAPLGHDVDTPEEFFRHAWDSAAEHCPRSKAFVRSVIRQSWVAESGPTFALAESFLLRRIQIMPLRSIRLTSEPHPDAVERTTANFVASRHMENLPIVDRDEHLIIDGQHRVAALLRLGRTHAACQVWTLGSGSLGLDRWIRKLDGPDVCLIAYFDKAAQLLAKQGRASAVSTEGLSLTLSGKRLSLPVLELADEIGLIAQLERMAPMHGLEVSLVAAADLTLAPLSRGIMLDPGRAASPEDAQRIGHSGKPAATRLNRYLVPGRLQGVPLQLEKLDDRDYVIGRHYNRQFVTVGNGFGFSFKSVGKARGLSQCDGEIAIHRK